MLNLQQEPLIARDGDLYCGCLPFTVLRFSCRFGYHQTVMPGECSQLVKGCQNTILSFSDKYNKMSVEHGVECKTCPVGAHYVHGRVERKIQSKKYYLMKNVDNNRKFGATDCHSSNNMI